MQEIVLKGASIIDGTGADISDGYSVVIEGTKIKEITRTPNPSKDALVYDVTGKTIMPGIIDSHTHTSLFATILIMKQTESLGYQYAKVVHTLRGCLDVGCTTIVDCGGLEAGFAKAQQEGLITSPRIYTSLMHIKPFNAWTDYMPGIGGTISQMGHTLNLPGLPSGHANGPDECRKKVREMILFGAQFIKVINSTHATARPWYDVGRSIYTMPELEAIVDEAHRAGLKVTIHAIGEESTRYSVLAGADSIDHGVFMDDATMDEMVKRGTWWIPTFAIFKFHATVNPDPNIKPAAVKMYEHHKLLFKKALAAGVKIAMGTDVNGAFCAGDGVTFEIAEMVNLGMTPLQAIKAATADAAKCLHVDHIGTLQKGKEADLLVVDGDPLKDITLLQDVNNIRLVMVAGKAVAGKMKKEFPWIIPDVARMPLKLSAVERNQ